MALVVTISLQITFGGVLLCYSVLCLGESTVQIVEDELTLPKLNEKPKNGYQDLTQNGDINIEMANAETIQRRAMNGCCKMCHKQNMRENATISNDSVTLNNTRRHKKRCCGMCKMMKMMMMMNETMAINGTDIRSNSSEMSNKNTKMKCCSMCGMSMAASGNDTEDNNNRTMCAICSMRMSPNGTDGIKTDVDGKDETASETEKKKAKHGCPMCRMMMKMKKKMCPMCMKHKMGRMSESTTGLETAVTVTDKPLNFVEVLVDDRSSLSGILVPGLLGALGVLVIVFVACLLKRRRRKLRRSRPSVNAMYSPVHGDEMKTGEDA